MNLLESASKYVVEGFGKPVTEFTNELMTEYIKWIKPLFLKEDPKLVEKLEILPNEPKTQGRLETRLEDMLEQEDFKKQLESWVQRLEQAAAKEKNTVVGTKIKGKNVHIGDVGAKNDAHWSKKNIIEGSEIEADGDFHLGDKG